MQRNYRIDALRILAAFMVILIHISAGYWLEYPVTDIHWKTVNFYDSLCRPAVPLFLMISGMFLLRPEKKLDGKILWNKYCKRILLLYLVWAGFYATWRDVFWNLIRGREIFWDQVLLNFFRGHYHLWYLVMLFGIYLILPFLRKIAEDRKLLEYFLLLTLAMTVLFPMIRSEYLDAMKPNLYFYFTLGFPGYFLAGYYFSRYPLSGTWRRLLYLGGILGAFFTYYGTKLWSESVGTPADCYSPFLPNVVLMSIGLFLFFQKETGTSRPFLAKWIPYIGSTTLGVYLIHPFFLSLLEHINLMPASFSVPFLLSFPLFAAGIFLISMLAVLFLKKLPWIGKHLL